MDIKLPKFYVQLINNIWSLYPVENPDDLPRLLKSPITRYTFFTENQALNFIREQYEKKN